MKNIWSSIVYVYIVGLVAVSAIETVGCVDENRDAGEAGAHAGSSGSISMSDAGGTGDVGIADAGGVSITGNASIDGTVDGGSSFASDDSSTGGTFDSGGTSGGNDSGLSDTGGGAVGGNDGAMVTDSSGDSGNDGGTETLEWLPSWATTIQNTEPDNLPPALQGNTLRQFIWPTVSGAQIRIQLSNEKGTAPVQIQKAHIAMAKTTTDPGNSGGQIDTSTDAAFTFSSMASVTIPAGETVWSDALDFQLQEISLTAVTIQFGSQVPFEITGHPGARTTSYIANGDAVAQEALAGAQTRDRWYFINAIEVMAPADAFAIAVLGDSITDGYGVLNKFERWPDFMTLAIHEDPIIANKRSVLNFGMGANNLTKSGLYQDAGVVRFERDVLTRDKIKWLVVLEGVNDIKYSGVQAQPIIDAYKQIITKAHEKGLKVFGSPITPMGSANSIRDTVNNWVRTSGEFDEVIDLDAEIRDPANPNNILHIYNNDGLHPNETGYQAMGDAVDLTLFYP